MSIKILTILLFMPFETFCQSFTLQKGSWNDFEGKIGKADIQLSIFHFDDGLIKDNYYYKKHEVKILLTGQIKNNEIELTELLSDKPNAHFQGKIFTDKLDRFEGKWIDSSKTTSLEFKLILQSICGDSYQHRYSNLASDEEVEKFMKHVKSSILINEKDWIANHISFPVKAKVGNRKITIKNKQQLISNFDYIFNNSFKDKIRSANTYNLFTNWHGVMLGNGEIWITDCSVFNNNFKYCIIAINN